MSNVDSSKLRVLAKKAREEYERLGPYEDDFVRPPVASFPAHVLEQDPLKVEGSVLETILDERGSAASEMMSGETLAALLDAYTQRGHEVLALEREIAHLRRGIEAYRAAHGHYRHPHHCESCDWEREDAERR